MSATDKCGTITPHSFVTILLTSSSFFFFFNDTATTEIYTLSLHDALPICAQRAVDRRRPGLRLHARWPAEQHALRRSEEHTSELQSPCNLVCRLLLEKKKVTDWANRLSALSEVSVPCAMSILTVTGTPWH